eukprot:UN02692
MSTIQHLRPLLRRAANITSSRNGLGFKPEYDYHATTPTTIHNQFFRTMMTKPAHVKPAGLQNQAINSTRPVRSFSSPTRSITTTISQKVSQPHQVTKSFPKTFYSANNPYVASSRLVAPCVNNILLKSIPTKTTTTQTRLMYYSKGRRWTGKYPVWFWIPIILGVLFFGPWIYIVADQWIYGKIMAFITFFIR